MHRLVTQKVQPTIDAPRFVLFFQKARGPAMGFACAVRNHLRTTTCPHQYPFHLVIVRPSVLAKEAPLGTEILTDSLVTPIFASRVGQVPARMFQRGEAMALVEVKVEKDLVRHRSMSSLRKAGGQSL